MIRVQREDFDTGRELDLLAAGDHAVGGVASFIGLVRDMGGPQPVSALSLEHYPGMTERKLAEIEAEANRRWPLAASLIIHRYGRLEPGDRIVLVATASPHREAALRPLQFPDRLAEDRRAVLEERGDAAGRALGSRARRGQRGDPALARGVSRQKN